MEKPLIKLTCIALLTTASSFALAEQALDLKVGMGIDQGFGVTMQYAESINAFIGNDGISADQILRVGSFDLDIPLSWYVGVGGAFNWSGDNEYSVRVPLGLTIPLADNWDVYAQGAPNLEYRDRSSGDNEFKFSADFALGIRYAF